LVDNGTTLENKPIICPQQKKSAYANKGNDLEEN
jgi:hypothetical protein